MQKLIYIAPTGVTTVEPDVAEIVGLVATLPPDYWSQGNGHAAVSFEAPHLEAELLILPHGPLGIYLKYLKCNVRRVEEQWLSLHDPAALGETVACQDDWLAAKGLFLPQDHAATAVEEFCRTGLRSPEVTWIRPAELPAGGSW
jgi:hypothetical protein